MPPGVVVPVPVPVPPPPPGVVGPQHFSCMQPLEQAAMAPAVAFAMTKAIEPAAALASAEAFAEA